MNRHDDAPRNDDAGSESPRAEASASIPVTTGGGVRVALAVVSVLLFLEAVVVSALVVWLVVDLFALEPSSYVTAIALIAIVVIGAIWVWAVASASLFGVPRGRGRPRSCGRSCSSRSQSAHSRGCSPAPMSGGCCSCPRSP